MKHFVASHLLHVFFVLAFVLAQVSPACAFVAGKTGSLEVCAQDGTIKTIKVPAYYDLSAFVKGAADKGEKPQPHKSTAEQCGFCFAQSHLTKAIVTSPLVTLPLSASDVLHIGAGSIVYKSYNSIQFQPRAPPYSLA